MSFLVQYGNYILVPIHILVCFILVAVVLLQTGKGTDWAGVFGGGGTQTAFGPRGVENTLSRLTKIAAVIFMLTSFSISLLQSRQEVRVLPDLPEGGAASAPSPSAPAPALPEAAVPGPEGDLTPGGAADAAAPAGAPTGGAAEVPPAGSGTP